MTNDKVHTFGKHFLMISLLMLAGLFGLCPSGNLFGKTPAETPPQTAKASYCQSPEYRQFDFWLGDWDAFEAGNQNPVARVRVDRILDGCVLHEDYQDTSGHKGQSFSIYDGGRKVWHQSWVTNRGELLIIEGTFSDGAMMLAGSDLTRDGKERRFRGTWKPEGKGVRETAVVSLDGGKTWKPWFDLMFLPHK